MQSKTIITDRLILNFPLVHRGADVSHYLRWLGDSEVTAYSEQRHLAHTVQSQLDYLSTFSGREDRFFWDIQVKGWKWPVGTITAHLDLPNKTANLGIMVGDRRARGRGYALEAWETISDFLFEQDIRKLEAGCMANNWPMRRLLGKAKFQQEGQILGHFLLNGNPEDMVLYGRFRQAKILTFPQNGE